MAADNYSLTQQTAIAARQIELKFRLRVPA